MKQMIDFKNNIQFGAIGLKGSSANGNQYDTKITQNSQNEQSGQTLKHQHMEEASHNLEWDRMHPDFFLSSNFEGEGIIQSAQPLQNQIKVSDQFKWQLRSNNLQYQHQMKLKQQSAPEDKIKNARASEGAMNSDRITSGQNNFKRPVIVRASNKFVRHQLLNHKLSNVVPRRNQMHGQNIQTKIVGAHGYESKRESQEILTLGSLRLSRQVRVNSEVPSEANSPLSAVYGPYEIQNFQLKPMGLPSPTLADFRSATETTPSPRKHHHLSLDPLMLAQPIHFSKMEDGVRQEFVPFQNNQLREQLRE